MAAFREAKRVDPRDTNPHCELAKILEEVKKDYAAAAAEYREVIRINPDEPDARSNLALMLYKSGKNAQAIAECRQAGKQHPDWADTRYKCGVILYNTGADYEAAVVEIRAAIALRPEANSYITLAKALWKLRKWKRLSRPSQSAIVDSQAVAAR